MRELVDHRYRVEHKLAAGGFGAIYQATDLSIDRPVALKVLHRELAGDANVVARFRREAAALATLKSPHTLTLYDVGETDDTLYIVMELLHGESLLQVFERSGPLPWQRIARIARGVCASLREAHAHGIVHRDLKPANIFVQSHGADTDFAKVLDFGIAKVLESSDLENVELTRHGQMVGTFDYMPPEQMVGGMTTARSDVFTLGVVIHEMITGVRPFGASPGPASMLMALLSTTPAPLTNVPLPLSRIISACLAREPDDRPDVAELDAVLASVLAAEEASFARGSFVHFDDDDEPTDVDARIPPRKTMMRGSLDGFLAVEAARELPLPPPVWIEEPSHVEPPKRLATGTSPIVNKPASPATPWLRYLLIASGLFGVGFAVALVMAHVAGS